MYEKLIDVLARTLGVNPATLNRDSSTENVPGWDSLRQFMIMMELETAFGVKFPIEKFAAATSIAKIETLLTEIQSKAA